MKTYNINTVKVYEKNGEEKKQWNRIGRLVHFDPSDKNPEGGYALELFMQPDTKFFVFEDKPREEYTAPAKKDISTDDIGAVEYPEEGIDPDDIPF